MGKHGGKQLACCGSASAEAGGRGELPCRPQPPRARIWERSHSCAGRYARPPYIIASARGEKADGAGWIKETKEITMVYRRKSRKAADCIHGRPTSSSWPPAAITEGEDARRRRGHWLGARTRRRSASRREGSKAEAEDGLGGDPRRRGMTRVVDRRPGAESRLGGRAQRDDEGAKGRSLQIHQIGRASCRERVFGYV